MIPENVKQIASEIFKIIEKYYPEAVKGHTVHERIEMCVYIELIKSGAFNAII